jgi:cytidylate kinase
MGGMRREIARKHGLTLAELNKVGETEAWTDVEADEYLKTEVTKQHDVVVDSRMAFFFFPNSLKVCITVAPDVGAERIFGALKKNPEKRNEAAALSSAADVERVNHERMVSDRLRYQKYYGIDDFMDHKHYDLVLDTTKLNPSEAFEALWQKVTPHLSA